MRTIVAQVSESANNAEAPSAAPAGTVFTGLSIYKDKPDPVARPESEYPPWLFSLLDDPAIKSSKTVGAGDVDTTGMSKGEARAALKRSAKAARQAAKKQAVAEAREAARRARRGEPLEEKREEVQEDKGPSTPAEAFEIELRQRRELRKKNRASIKAANFVKST